VPGPNQVAQRVIPRKETTITDKICRSEINSFAEPARHYDLIIGVGGDENAGVPADPVQDPRPDQFAGRIAARQKDGVLTASQRLAGYDHRERESAADDRAAVRS
jgi:hypothetical protein